jgi:FKBP-type peptidyl-prolyl cis-trans isomerase (trigger factor)
MADTDHLNHPPIARHPNGNVDIQLIIPWSKIQAGYETEVQKAIDETEIPGFRKGKAPRDIVEPKLDRSNLISKALGDILPEIYAQKVNEFKLKPIMYPHIHIDKNTEGADWEFVATTCEVPEVTLPDYKTDLPKEKVEKDQSKVTVAVSYLHKNSKVQVPDMLVEEESNHRLASLADNLTHLGLDIPKYLQSKKLTTESLKAQTAAESRIDLEMEFILSQVQAQEKLENREKTLEFLQNLIV